MPGSNLEYYKNYYTHQAQQKGGNLSAFHGGRVQQGYGLGSMLKGLFRWAVPHLTSGAKAVGRQALKEGLGVTQDVMNGQSVGNSVRKRGQEAVNQANFPEASANSNWKRSKAYKKAIQRQTGQFFFNQEAENISNPKTVRIQFLLSMVHPRSHECSKSELDLFIAPSVQTNIERGKWIEYYPVSNVTDSGPIEFNVPGSGDEYTDLRQAWLYNKVKITKANGDALADDEKVGPVNLFLQAMYSQVDVSLNDKLISSSTNTNPYRAMITTLMTYGSDAKTSQLGAELFVKDTPGRLEVVDPLALVGARNHGLHTRYNYIKESSMFELMGPLHSDLFCQDRLLLNGVTLRIRLNRSKNAFCLVSPTVDADYKVVVVQSTLYVRKVKIYNDTFLGIASALQHAPALYPIQRVECKAMSIPAGLMSFTPDDVFLGQIPKRIVLGLVENTSFNGSLIKNPFNFQHFNATQVGVYVNGESSPMKALQLNFEQSLYLPGYMSLFSGTGTLFHNQGNQISRQDYPEGYTLFAFDLSPDLSAGPHVSTIKQGNLRIGIQFGAPLPATVNCIIYAEFDSLIEIDANRNVTFNWSN